MKAVWQGYIALGRLGIPVRLYSAIQTAHPEFVLLHDKDGSPVERVLACKAEHTEIAYEDIVRAIQYEPGQYVTVSNRELESAAPNQAKAIAVQQFADQHAIPPRYYEKPFYIVPGKGGERAYALLREVLARSGKIAITQLVMRNREYLAALTVQEDLLMLLRLHFAAELVPRDQVKTPPLAKPTPQEIEALAAVVDRFSGPVYMHDYHDEQAEIIKELVERKVKGLPARRREPRHPQATPEEQIVPALQDTLRGQRMLDSGLAD